MKARVLVASLSLTLLLSGGIAVAAEEHKDVVSTEQKKTAVDAQTGDVTQQESKHTDKQAVRTSPAGATAEQEHSAEGSTTVQGQDGTKAEVKQQDKTSAAVTAHPDGDVSVEQKKQHSEHRATN